jgi:hypothetical protein
MKLRVGLEVFLLVVALWMFCYPLTLDSATSTAIERQRFFWDYFLLMPLGLLVGGLATQRWIKPN